MIKPGVLQMCVCMYVRERGGGGLQAQGLKSVYKGQWVSMGMTGEPPSLFQYHHNLS